MVVYYGMSDRLPNLCYYDSTGQDYGFSKPYSDERAKIIDQEVSRIIAEQYDRAKAILKEHTEGHNKLADVLITREVIFTEDVENIFGKRPWVSRTDEILAAKAVTDGSDGNGHDVTDVDAKDVTDESGKHDADDTKDGGSDGKEALPPPFPG